MKLNITALIIFENDALEEVIYSFEESEELIEQDLLEQLNNIHNNTHIEKINFRSLREVDNYFDKVFIEKQTIQCQKYIKTLLDN